MIRRCCIIATTNQIAYLNYVETMRHNRRQESIGREQNRINYLNAQTNAGNLDVNRRQVGVAEYNARTANFRLGEEQRHNLVTERISQGNLDLQTGYLNETIRHNVQNENIGYQQASASLQQAANTYSMYEETKRHNLQEENLTQQQRGISAVSTLLPYAFGFAAGRNNNNKGSGTGSGSNGTQKNTVTTTTANTSTKKVNTADGSFPSTEDYSKYFASTNRDAAIAGLAVVGATVVRNAPTLIRFAL